MNRTKLVLESLRYHWRINLSVALGVMVASAVLTGALLVGDSVRGSLRELTLDRLGKIDEVLVAPHFFRTKLAEELAAEPEFQAEFDKAFGAIVLRGTLIYQDPQGNQSLSGQVNILGVDENFWNAGEGGPKEIPGTNEVVLNAPLAAELGVKVDEDVLLKLRQASQVPADSPLGKKDELVETRPLQVVDIIPADGLGRFGLEPNQQLPRTAYTSLRTLQNMLDRRNGMNAIFVIGKQPADQAPTAAADETLNNLLQPKLEDFGLRLKQTKRGYYDITSDRMILSEPVEEALLTSLKAEHPQAALTYLANTISAGKEKGADDAGLREDDAQIWYSTVSAIDFADSTGGDLGPWKTVDGETLTDIGDGIVLNQWAFDDLNEQLKKSGGELKIGDEVRLTYFEPEHAEGKTVDTTTSFRLVGVVPLDEASPAHDQALTPEVPGVTDRDSIDDWDPPFPFYQSRVRPIDEEYWDEYRATPKAFVSLKRGQELWGSRFGQATAIRLPNGPDVSEEKLLAAIKIEPADQGFLFQPIKRHGLMAASGTTPFNVLFLSFSFFIIAAAVMLVALLFRLGVEQRAGEVGIMEATGFSTTQVRRVFAMQGLVLSALAALVGTAAGAGYAWLMVYGLRTWWVDAVSTPFLQLHTTVLSFAVGYLSGVLVSFVTIWWTLWRMRNISPRRLLAGQANEEQFLSRSKASRSRWIAIVSGVLAVGVAAYAAKLGGEAQAGAFFGSGSLVLIASLALLWHVLRRGAFGSFVRGGSMPLVWLAVRNAARNPARSTLTVGLVASATFLIVAVSAFHIDPTNRPPELGSGDGGFALVAESATPVFRDLNQRATLQGLGLQDDEIQKMQDATVFSLRVKPGEDASCRNLYQTIEPRVLGLPDPLIKRGGFSWMQSAAATPEEKENPWLLLEADAGQTPDGTPYVPMVLDMNTAFYSLHLYTLGQTFNIEDDHGRQVPLKLVGLLQNSIFQGDVLISEQQFLKNFPDVSGYGFFLIEAPQDEVPTVSQTLETALADQGFDTQTTGDRLAGFLAVQNTYLSTFQSLGGLGLLLGTFGLATVQLRNVFERRGELALLRAAGFRRAKLGWLVLIENAWLLLKGLGIGLFAALIAVWPHLWGGTAGLPWNTLILTLSAVFVVGLIAGFLAVRATLRAPLLPALRGE